MFTVDRSGGPAVGTATALQSYLHLPADSSGIARKPALNHCSGEEFSRTCSVVSVLALPGLNRAGLLVSTAGSVNDFGS